MGNKLSQPLPPDTAVNYLDSSGNIILTEKLSDISFSIGNQQIIPEMTIGQSDPLLQKKYLASQLCQCQVWSCPNCG